MKILQIITLCELGGAQSVVINLANELSKNHEVIVAAGEGDGKMWPMLKNNIKKEYCKTLKRAISPIDDFRTLFTFIKLYIKYKPDIIHLHSSKAGMLGRIIFPSNKIIYTVHGFDSIRLAHRIFLPIERFMQRYNKAIVGVSNYDMHNMQYEKITRNVCTIYNGIKEQNSCENISFPFLSDKKKILCIARVAKPKRLDIFLKTAELLPEYDFIWIGNNQEIKTDLANVHFLGNIPNASIYNSISDLFILPSDFEGLPMVIIEAMSYKRPIVASNVGGINEIVQNGENGYVVNNDAQHFAQRIKEIIENQELYNKLSNNSYIRYKKDLTINKMVDLYLELYKQ